MFQKSGYILHDIYKILNKNHKLSQHIYFQHYFKPIAFPTVHIPQMRQI